jgi:hypothetical protein
MFNQKQRGIYSEFLVNSPEISKALDNDPDILGGADHTMDANPR